MTSFNLTETFNTNGKSYKTDSETLTLLNSLHADQKHTCLLAVFRLGEKVGRIVETS
ncbi:MAG: hypothetical protein H0U60_13240 [Blastocatellia bacterium]|nr:hypothetical protein [Blastocatellia bacterium]